MSSPMPQGRSRMPRIAEVAVERARLTVVPRRRTRAARMPFVALVSLLLLGGVVGLLLFNTSMQQASFAATSLEARATALAARQQTLQMDVERLRNPQRIAAAALKLGMVQSPSTAFLELGTGKVLGDASVGDPGVPFRINPLPPRKPAVLDPPPHIVHAPSTSTDSGDTTSANPQNGTGNGKKNHLHQQNQ